MFLLRVNRKRRNSVKCQTRNLPTECEWEKDELSQMSVFGEVRVLHWTFAGRMDVRKGRVTAWRGWQTTGVVDTWTLSTRCVANWQQAMETSVSNTKTKTKQWKPSIYDAIPHRWTKTHYLLNTTARLATLEFKSKIDWSTLCYFVGVMNFMIVWKIAL